MQQRWGIRTGRRAGFMRLWPLLCLCVWSCYRPPKITEGAQRGGKHGKRMMARANFEQDVLDMFYHGFNNYMQHAFPHDELKPISKTYTDSLGELGNIDGVPVSGNYRGAALTLTDALSTLAVMGDARNFERGVDWLIANMSYDLDVRVNVFEANIRMLGGLLSAHLLAQDPVKGPLLMPGGYSGGLLVLAEDLGKRLMPAFTASPTGLPFAWINLRHGIFQNESVYETNTAAAGSFIIEMGVLSRLTGQPEYELAARRSLHRLWSMRTPLGLFGTSLDMTTATWLDNNGGIGASADSFYEYLLKAYVLFGERQFFTMFEAAYTAAMRHYRGPGGWYPMADIWLGTPTHRQFTSLQAYWPGVQVLAGDVRSAEESFAAFFSVWQRWGVLPERYYYEGGGSLHPTEDYYPLRPELLESAFVLHQATRSGFYLEAAQQMMDGLIKHSRVDGGFASIRSVATMEKEDHMHSFFLAETCKYLFLIANDTFMRGGNYIFTTEGHPIPVDHPLLRQPVQPSREVVEEEAQHNAAMCPAEPLPVATPSPAGAGALDPGAEQRTARGEAERAVVQGQPAQADAATALLPGGIAQSARSAPIDRAAAAVLAGSAVAGERWEEEERTVAADVGFGSLHSNRSALGALVCPDYAVGRVVSVCHIRDWQDGAACRAHSDCGIDGRSCRQRLCSDHGFCVTPEQGKRTIVWQEQNGQRSIVHLHHQQHHLPALQVFGEPGTKLQGILESIGHVQLQIGQGVVQV